MMPLGRILALLLSLFALVPALLQAGPVAAAPSVDGILDDARQLLSDRVQANAEALGAHIEVRFPSLAAERVRGAPCAAEAFVPPGTRVWGKTYVGLRCEGSAWQARIPADVALLADVPVLLRPVAAGQTLQASDWAQAEINIAAWPRGVSADASKLEGARVVRPLRAGEPVPPDAIRSAGSLNAGDPVQVVLVGSGFLVKTAGKMLRAANPGQPARVQLDSGRTVAGTLRDDGEVRVEL